MMSLIRKWAAYVQKSARNKRFQFFMSTLHPRPMHIVLDLGGGYKGFFPKVYPYKERVIFLDINLSAARDFKFSYSDAMAVVANARCLPFRDQAIDIVFSNSVIEHVLDQEAFAREIQRVSRAYFVQTPNKGFPMDSHYLIPFFQFLPIALQRFVYERIGGGWWRRQQRIYEPIHYLSDCRLRQLFPDSEIAHERFLLMTKSFYCHQRMKNS